MLINPKQPIIRQIREGEYEYQADLYDAKVFFNDPQADDYNHLMRIVKYDKELTFKMLNASPTNITVDKDNQLTYHNVFEGVDTVYTLYPDKVKEDIIINSPEAEHVFKFRVYESLPATMQDSGDIIYSNNDNDNQNVFELPAPYATDTNNNTVDVEMIHEEGYYTYKVIPNKNTVYPIILDPTVGVSVSNNITTAKVPTYTTGKREATAYMYLNDFGIKIKTIKFLSYRDYTNNASADSTISFYNEENTLLKTSTSTTKGKVTYPVYDITDDINKITFYSMASNTQTSSNVYSFAYNGISTIYYDSKDGYIPVANITKETSTNIITIKFTSTMKMNVNDISFLSFTNTDEPQDISINSITVNNNDVDINNFSTKNGDSVIIKAYSPNCTPKVVGLRHVDTQEHQLLNVNEKIIADGQELLSMNENIIGVDNNQFNLEERIINSGNSKLSININVDDPLRNNIPVYVRNNKVDSSLFVYQAFNSELANYIKIVGCDISSSEYCSCTYADYNDNYHHFPSSGNAIYISNNNGIKSVWSSTGDESTILYVKDVTVERFDANLEPDFFTYGDVRITFEDEHIVKLVNGDIYEVIDSNMGDISSNLIPLGRDKILVRTDKTYYIKYNECKAVGVFKYFNTTIEKSLLFMNENIYDVPNIELIENIYATEKSGIQTKEYIIKGNEYQYINTKENIYTNESSELLSINENTIEVGNNQFNFEENIVNGGNPDINIKELISANESELLSINENTIEVNNDQFNLEEYIVNGGNPDINTKEFIYANKNSLLLINENTIEAGNNQFNLNEYIANGGNSNIDTKELIYANESSELPIKINVDTLRRENIPVYTKQQGKYNTYLFVVDAFNNDLANYVKILGCTISTNRSCSCYYYDYYDNKHYFMLYEYEPNYIFDNNGIKSFWEEIHDDYICQKVTNVTVDRLDTNLEPEFFVYDDIPITFKDEHIVKIVNGDIYEIIDPRAELDTKYMKPLRDTTLVQTDKKYYITTHYGNHAVGVFRYVNAAIENSLLSMNEKIYKDNVTIENSLLPMNEKIYDNTAIKNSLLSMNERIFDNAAIKNSLLPINEKIYYGSNVELIENIYATEKEVIPLIEKIVSDANSDLISIKELVSTPDNTVIDIKENIQLARDLNIIEKVFIKDSILLPITEGITTENDSLIRILENVKNSSEDRLDIKEYIATGIGEEKLDIIEKITISDETVIDIIENIVIDGYSCIPIEENIVISGNDKIDINENIVEKAEEKIVLLEEVKILGNDTVSIIENVKPVSLTIVENIRREVDYATRLITFTKPTFTYKKGK